MKIHEYQAKEILSQGDIPIPRGKVVFTPEDARRVADELGIPSVVKAQVHAGGRGKVGGIRSVSSGEDAERAAGSLLGSRLVTSQTGLDGVPVECVLVEEALEIEREMYLGMTIDGSAKNVVMIASAVGGVDIEEIAEKTPEEMLRVEIDPMIGLKAYHARNIVDRLNLKSGLARDAAKILQDLNRIFGSYDCSLIEINPLVETVDGRILAADAKLNFDDDALFRHPDIQRLRDRDQEDPLEAQASQFGISYVSLDGEVGCMVNGAGLALGTMDVIVQAGTTPANFLDVGGSADEEKVMQALRIILSDQGVTSILVNIFGGILRCDIVARGILLAADSMPDSLRPIVVRMSGTNSQQGRELLEKSTLDVTLVDNFTEAAEAIRKYSQL